MQHRVGEKKKPDNTYVFRLENGQGDCAALGGREKEILIPPMLLAGYVTGRN